LFFPTACAAFLAFFDEARKRSLRRPMNKGRSLPPLQKRALERGQRSGHPPIDTCHLLPLRAQMTCMRLGHPGSDTRLPVGASLWRRCGGIRDSWSCLRPRCRFSLHAYARRTQQRDHVRAAMGSDPTAATMCRACRTFSALLAAFAALRAAGPCPDSDFGSGKRGSFRASFPLLSLPHSPLARDVLTFLVSHYPPTIVVDDACICPLCWTLVWC